MLMGGGQNIQYDDYLLGNYLNPNLDLYQALLRVRSMSVTRNIFSAFMCQLFPPQSIRRLLRFLVIQVMGILKLLKIL